MPTVTDGNGTNFRTRLEPRFWLGMAALVFTVTSTVGGTMMTFGKWYVDDAIRDEVSRHSAEVRHLMDAKVELWWEKRKAETRLEWRSEIRAALLEHMNMPAHGSVRSDIESLRSEVRELNAKITRIEIALARLSNGIGLEDQGQGGKR